MPDISLVVLLVTRPGAGKPPASPQFRQFQTETLPSGFAVLSGPVQSPTGQP